MGLVDFVGKEAAESAFAATSQPCLEYFGVGIVGKTEATVKALSRLARLPGLGNCFALARANLVTNCRRGGVAGDATQSQPTDSPRSGLSLRVLDCIRRSCVRGDLRLRGRAV